MRLFKSLFVVLLLSASTAYAGFDVEMDGATAYGYTGSACSAAGSHAGKTVPRCTGTADGGFYLRYFTKSLSPTTITPQKIRFTTVGDPNDSASAACFKIACTATSEGSNPHGAISFNSGTTLTYDMDADSCITQDKECITGAASVANMYDLNTSADCAGAGCNNTEMVCWVQYLGTAGTGCTNGYTGGIDLSSMLLNVN